MTTLEATRYLVKYYYKEPKVDVIKIVEKGNLSIPEVIRKYFKDPHTYYDNSTKTEDLPRPWVNVRVQDSPTRILNIKLGPFIGLNRGTSREKDYVRKCQEALKYYSTYPLIIDLTENTGGDEKIMLKALRGVNKRPGTVLVSKSTASAGEMVAATLIYDYGFKRRGPRTAGALSILKNVILSDGSFLGITTGNYTTPGGHFCRRFFL